MTELLAFFISAAILSGKASLYRSETNGNESGVCNLPRKLLFVPYFSLRSRWRFFQDGQNVQGSECLRTSFPKNRRPFALG
ncbi:MAG: hypothetical protein GY821_12085 [Gammaproteobacteria bacterium]|nr:hypothetical protein [Gammaproteobacteria bacterium]